MKHFNINDFKIVYDGTFLEVPKINQLTKEQAKELLDVVLFWVENDSLPDLVDWELEEAKKKYKLGSYFKTMRSDDILKVKDVFRGEDEGTIFIQAKAGSCKLIDCTPFPIPVWRCCESDKPTKSGNYFVRLKERNADREGSRRPSVEPYAEGDWDRIDPIYYRTSEWLDEGGE